MLVNVLNTLQKCRASEERFKRISKVIENTKTERKVDVKCNFNRSTI